VVTEDMGAREVVEEIDPGLVAEANPESLAETIIDYLELSEERKLELSREFREMSEEFSPEKRGSEFRETFSQVLEEAENSS
jgi:glycosyltransferase involved in cell wall biosynthesis